MVEFHPELSQSIHFLHLSQDGERFSNRIFPVIRHADSGINFHNQHEGKSFGQGKILARRKAGTVGESPTCHIWQLCPPSRVQFSTSLLYIQILDLFGPKTFQKDQIAQGACPLEETNKWDQKPSHQQLIPSEPQTSQGTRPSDHI
jgi:hypothetical protein